jgi:hypothetical protein
MGPSLSRGRVEQLPPQTTLPMNDSNATHAFPGVLVTITGLSEGMQPSLRGGYRRTIELSEGLQDGEESYSSK